MIYILIALVLLFCILYWDVNSDFKKWLKNQAVRHKSEWRLRALLCTPIIILFTVAHPAEHGYSWATFWVLACSICMIGFTWWMLFDGWYNLKRRNYLKNTGASPSYYMQFDWWYVGSFNEEGHSDSCLDRLQFWLGNTTSKIVKVVGVALWVVIYILSFQTFVK